MAKGGIVYDRESSSVFAAQGLMNADWSSRYQFSLLQINESNLEVLQDFNYGQESNLAYNGAQKILEYKNQFLIIAGAIEDSNYDDDYPQGGFFVFEKSDLESASTSSIRYSSMIQPWGAWDDIFFPFDFDIDEENDILVAIVSSAAYPNTSGHWRYGAAKYGRSGDTHDVRIDKYSLNSSTGDLALLENFGMDVSEIDSCETVNIYGDNFYVSCGYLYDMRNTEELPAIFVFRTSDRAYLRHIEMGFRLTMDWASLDSYHLFQFTQIVGSTLFLHGKTQQIYSSGGNWRFPFVQSFELENEKVGGHLGQSFQTTHTDSTHIVSRDTQHIAGTFQLGLQSASQLLVRTYSDLDPEDIKIYDALD